jgi:ATP synthase F0 subunit c
MEMDVLTRLLSYLGAAFAMGMAAIGTGIGNGHTADQACEGITRQPAARDSIFRLMLISQAVTESAAIFALVIAMLLIFRGVAPSLEKGVAMVAAGISIGFGAAGAAFGSGLTGANACKGLSRHPRTGSSLTVMMLTAQAVVQTSVIFALVVALILIITDFPGSSLVQAAAILGAGVSAGFGAIGPAMGTGFAGSKAVDGLSRNPREAPLLTRTMLLGQAVAQSTSIYSLVIALLLIYAL